MTYKIDFTFIEYMGFRLLIKGMVFFFFFFFFFLFVCLFVCLLVGCGGEGGFVVVCVGYDDRMGGGIEKS